MRGRAVGTFSLLGGILVFASVSAGVLSSWSHVETANIESVKSSSVGAGITAWSGVVNLTYDPNSSAGAAGDFAGTLDLTVTSALYGVFSKSGIPLTLVPAGPKGCGGTWAAEASGTPAYLASADGWDGPSGKRWSWSPNGSYACFQGADQKLAVVITNGDYLGPLWGNTPSSSGTGILANAATGFRWSGIASLTSDNSATWTQGQKESGSVALAADLSSVAALRNLARKNLGALTRNVSPRTSPESLATFDGQSDLLYYDFSGHPGSVEIDGNKGPALRLGGVSSTNGSFVNGIKVSGKKTVVVKGGNLHIAADMRYSSPSDIAVFVVLRDEKNPKNGGNVYVDPGVTNLVGTFILDGSLLNLSGSTVLSSEDPADIPSLRRQLFVYGQLASANTVGGSSAGTPACPYGSDAEKNGTACSKETAAKYDLSVLRKFYLGSSRQLAPFSVGLSGDAKSCATASGAANPEYEVPRLTDGASVWDAQPWAWAGKKKCYLSDPQDPLLKVPPPALRKSPVSVELNPAVLSAPLKILSQ